MLIKLLEGVEAQLLAVVLIELVNEIPVHLKVLFEGEFSINAFLLKLVHQNGVELVQIHFSLELPLGIFFMGRQAFGQKVFEVRKRFLSVLLEVFEHILDVLKVNFLV